MTLTKRLAIIAVTTAALYGCGHRSQTKTTAVETVQSQTQEKQTAVVNDPICVTVPPEVRDAYQLRAAEAKHNFDESRIAAEQAVAGLHDATESVRAAEEQRLEQDATLGRARLAALEAKSRLDSASNQFRIGAVADRYVDEAQESYNAAEDVVSSTQNGIAAADGEIMLIKQQQQWALQQAAQTRDRMREAEAAFISARDALGRLPATTCTTPVSRNYTPDGSSAAAASAASH